MIRCIAVDRIIPTNWLLAECCDCVALVCCLSVVIVVYLLSDTSVLWQNGWFKITRFLLWSRSFALLHSMFDYAQIMLWWFSTSSSALSRKRCETELKSNVIANFKSYISFRFVQKSMTSNDSQNAHKITSNQTVIREGATFGFC